MLKRLKVRDLALVAGADVSFGPGLNLLTGETGSGKSLIVDALSLTLGARASTEQVRHGSDRALVESVFEISDVPAALRALEEMGIEPEPELVMTREVGGRGGARLNGHPASPGQLRQLGRLLVDVHGQHEHQSLLDTDAQTALLDSFGRALEARSRVAETWSAWRAAGERLKELENVRERGSREREFMEWQLNELRGAGLRDGEDSDLASERALSRHAVRLTELSQGARDELSGGEGPARALVLVRAAAELDPRLGGAGDRLAAVAAEIDDLAQELRRYGETLDADPKRLEALESRLAQLEAIKKRFGGSLEAAIAERDRLELALAGTEDLAAALAAAEAEVATRRRELEVAAAALSKARGAAGARLARQVAAELGGLRLAGARFEVAFEPRTELGPEGAEQAVMMFSANPGEPLGALARVASGGELARVMLAIKTVGAEADRLPTLIFDEVDAGIGGEAALQVGVRLRGLGGAKQVLVVTHLAQIACFGDHHLVVEKRLGAEGRNLVAVRELDGEGERAAELARMMSGGVTDKALARARELLEEARG